MNAEQRFGGERVREYDRGIRKMVPGYESLHDMAGALLRTYLAEQARVLVVGAGTGAEILGLGARSSGWRFTGVDPSADMLSIARGRIEESGLTGRVELRTGFVHELPRSPLYDAATSILVMHFLPDDGGKLGFLRDISSRLRPGAPLVLADLHADETSLRFERFLGAWRERQLALGMEEKDAEEYFRELTSVVRFVPEERIRSLLEEAGFEEVTPFYSALLFGGWVARRERKG